MDFTVEFGLTLGGEDASLLFAGSITTAEAPAAMSELLTWKRQVECLRNPGFISRIHEVKSPSKAFLKGRRHFVIGRMFEWTNQIWYCWFGQVAKS